MSVLPTSPAGGYGKEAGRSPAASEGEGGPQSPASLIVAPMPLAEVELKWEMEKEERDCSGSNCKT